MVLVYCYLEENDCSLSGNNEKLWNFISKNSSCFETSAFFFFLEHHIFVSFKIKKVRGTLITGNVVLHLKLV